jgi:hypothetical protein
MKTVSIQEIKFEENEPLIVSCFTFNENKYRFGFIIGHPNEDLNNEDEYCVTFLDNKQAKELIEFLTKHITP